MYNKRKFNKIDDKKVLHKVKKQWVTISLALFMMIGGGAVATHVNASADTTNNQNQQQVSVKLGSRKGNKNTITNKAKALHQNLLSKANLNKPTANKNLHNHNQINTTHQGNLVTINNKPAKKVNNINKVGMHKANLYHGYVYNRIDKPFQNLRINHTVALHSSINLNSGHIFGYLHSGRIVKANRMFKQFGYDGNYLRYEINLANRRTAFITGNNHFVSYVIPARNYKYYQNKAKKLIKNANYKDAKKVGKNLYRLNKQRNHNFHRYANLYEMAFNAQQNHKYSVVVNYNAKKHTSDITPTSDVTSVAPNSSANSISTQYYNYSPATPSYVAPAVAPTNSNSVVIPKSSSASVKSMNSASSINSSTSKSASSVSNDDEIINALAKDNVSARSYVNEADNDTRNSNLNLQSNYVSEANNYDSLVNNEASLINNDSLDPNSNNLVNANSAIQSASLDVSNENNIVSEANSAKNSEAAVVKPKPIKNSEYDGLMYNYNPNNNNLEFTSGTLSINKGNSLLFGTNIPSDISDATSIKFDNNVNTSNMSDMSGLFANDSRLKALDLGDNFDTSKVSDMKGMFKSDNNLQTLTLKGKNIQSPQVPRTNGKLLLGTTNDTGFNTSNVKDMSYMFSHDSDLTELDLPDSFNTNNVSNMKDMFSGDSNLKNISINSLYTKFNSLAFDDNSKWQQNSTPINLGDGKSHIGTFTNVTANHNSNKNINISNIKSDILDDINNGRSNNKLQEGTTYSHLANNLVNSATANWNSDLTLIPSDLLVHMSDGKNVVSGMSDPDYDESIVRVNEKKLGIKMGPSGIYHNGLFGIFDNTPSRSDFHVNYIHTPYSDSSDNMPGNNREPDRPYIAMHTHIRYSKPISIEQNMSSSDMAKLVLNAIGNFNIPDEELSKHGSEIGIGLTQKNGKLRAIYIIGPVISNIQNIQEHHMCHEVKSDSQDVNHLTGLSYLPNDFVSDVVGEIEKNGNTKRIPLISDSDIRSLATSPVEVVDSVPVLKRAISDVSTKVSSIEKVPFHEAKLNVCNALGEAAHKLQPGEYATFDKIEAESVAAVGGISIAGSAIASFGPSLEGITSSIKNYFDGLSSFMNGPIHGFGLTAPNPKEYADGCIHLIATNTIDYISGHESFSDYEKSNITGVIDEAIEQYCKDYVKLTTSSYGNIYDFEKAPFLNDSATLYYLNSHCGKYMAIPLSFIKNLKLFSSKGVEQLRYVLTSDLGDHTYYTFPK